MCGRYTLTAQPDQIVAAFGLPGISEYSPRYNIAPTQGVPVVRAAEANDEREFAQLRWGLVPFWAKDLKIGNRMINARGETVATKPSFRQAFVKRRCLVIADGFYEWKKLGKNEKQPYYIHRKDASPFGFAGLWERWNGEDGQVESCTIITTSANALMEPLHDRMPVILDPEDYETWLDPSLQERDEVERLLASHPMPDWETYPVSTIVNNPRNESPECIERV